MLLGVQEWPRLKVALSISSLKATTKFGKFMLGSIGFVGLLAPPIFWWFLLNSIGDIETQLSRSSCVLAPPPLALFDVMKVKWCRQLWTPSSLVPSITTENLLAYGCHEFEMKQPQQISKSKYKVWHIIIEVQAHTTKNALPLSIHPPNDHLLQKYPSNYPIQSQ